MDKLKIKILNKINSDKLFQNLKHLLSKKLSNIRRKNLRDLLVFRFQELTSFDINLYIFDDEGKPLILLYKKDGKSYSRSFKINSCISEQIIKLPKDGKWYRNDDFKGYIRYTPAYLGSGDYFEEDFLNFEESYDHGYQAGYQTASAGNHYDDTAADESSEFEIGYNDGYEDGIYDYVYQKTEYARGYGEGFMYSSEGNDINDVDFSNQSSYYGNGFEEGYKVYQESFKEKDEGTDQQLNVESSSAPATTLKSVDPTSAKSGIILKIYGSQLYNADLRFELEDGTKADSKMYNISSDKSTCNVDAPFKDNGNEMQGSAIIYFADIGSDYYPLNFTFE